MQEQEVKDKTIAIVKEMGGFPDDRTITMSDNLRTALEFDELDLTELVMAFEEEFNVAITNEEINNWQTVFDAFECLQKKID